ncbi:acyltransferase family protein, partial [Photobacterium sp. ZSDE20]|nr:acyltransferase family protein [Photobacterium sp. ZSDE20]
MRNNKQVNSIQMLRGICALLVVWAHSYIWVDDVYPNMGQNIFSFAFVGVDIFFIISGFIITYVTDNKKEQVATLFLIKRFFRVVPLAWVAMLLYGFASGYSISDLFNNNDFIKSLLFIPIDSSAQAPAYGYGFLIVTWTLIYEIIFYLIFSLSMLINGKYRSAICSVAI